MQVVQATILPVTAGLTSKSFVVEIIILTLSTTGTMYQNILLLFALRMLGSHSPSTPTGETKEFKLLGETECDCRTLQDTGNAVPFLKLVLLKPPFTWALPLITRAHLRVAGLSKGRGGGSIWPSILIRMPAVMCCPVSSLSPGVWCWPGDGCFEAASNQWAYSLYSANWSPSGLFVHDCSWQNMCVTAKVECTNKADWGSLA